MPDAEQCRMLHGDGSPPSVLSDERHPPAVPTPPPRRPPPSADCCAGASHSTIPSAGSPHHAHDGLRCRRPELDRLRKRPNRRDPVTALALKLSVPPVGGRDPRPAARSPRRTRSHRRRYVTRFPASPATALSTVTTLTRASVKRHSRLIPSWIAPVRWTVSGGRIDRRWGHSEVDAWPDTAPTASSSSARIGPAPRCLAEPHPDLGREVRGRHLRRRVPGRRPSAAVRGELLPDTGHLHARGCSRGSCVAP